MTTKEILKKLQGKNETLGFICVNKILIKKIGIAAFYTAYIFLLLKMSAFS